MVEYKCYLDKGYKGYIRYLKKKGYALEAPKPKKPKKGLVSWIKKIF